MYLARWVPQRVGGDRLDQVEGLLPEFLGLHRAVGLRPQLLGRGQDTIEDGLVLQRGMAGQRLQRGVDRRLVVVDGKSSRQDLFQDRPRLGRPIDRQRRDHGLDQFRIGRSARRRRSRLGVGRGRLGRFRRRQQRGQHARGTGLAHESNAQLPDGLGQPRVVGGPRRKIVVLDPGRKFLRPRRYLGRFDRFGRRARCRDRGRPVSAIGRHIGRRRLGRAGPFGLGRRSGFGRRLGLSCLVRLALIRLTCLSRRGNICR